MQEYFSEIEDPRHEGYVKYKLADVLTIVMCAVMCRTSELCEIMVFAESKSEFLAENFGITKIPAYQIDEILRNELNKIENQTALTAFLYQQNFINKLQNENQQLKEKLQK